MTFKPLAWISLSLLLFCSLALAAESMQGAETRPREAPQLVPAFKGQTRAPLPAKTETWQLETVIDGLEHPWALAFLPDGSLLITERPGRLRHADARGHLSAPIEGVPAVDARNQGGLLDVAIAPDFENSRRIYLSFAQPQEDGSNNTALARATLSENLDRLEDLELLFSQTPSATSTGHFGSRIVLQDAHTLWLTLGDRQHATIRDQAQNLGNYIGKVVRLHTDGRIPADNPFHDQEGRAEAIWSWGHRNVQGATLDPQSGELWTVEHGPRGGDELNLTRAGRNYGWPILSYGIEYSGKQVGLGLTEAEGMEQPVYFWDPIIAPSGLMFYSGEAFPAWQGNLFVGGLRSQRISRLVLENNRVIGEEWLPIGQRVRDLKTGPDGYIYLITDEDRGQLLRIIPAP